MAPLANVAAERALTKGCDRLCGFCAPRTPLDGLAGAAYSIAGEALRAHHSLLRLGDQLAFRRRVL